MSEEPTRNFLQDGFDRILARLDALEDKVERRLQDTRPIWEQVLVRLGGVESRLDNFGERLDNFGERMDGFATRLDGFETELRSSLRRFERQVGLLAEDVMQVRADQSDLDRRVDRIESKLTP